MITFLGLEHMVDATQDLRLGSGGVKLRKLGCPSWSSLCFSRYWGGRGGVEANY